MTEKRNDTPITSNKRVKSNHWVAAVPSLVIPVCIGLSMHLGLSYLVDQSIITNELLIRYTTGHPISQVTTAMFFVGLASLLLIAKNVFEQFNAEETITLAITASPDSDSPASVEETEPSGYSPQAEIKNKPTSVVSTVCQAAQTHREQLDTYPAAVHEHYLWRRLAAMMAHLQRSDSTATADDELKYLSELDIDRQQQRFALARILIWATPMLGFLGTVLGISEALGGINVGPDNDFQNMMNGLRGSLYVAFDTTALALTLSMLLMFCQFVIDRFETQLLELVDIRSRNEVSNHFDLTSGESAGLQQFTSEFLQASKESVSAQTKIWSQTIHAAEKAWASTLTDANANVQENLSDALQANIGQLSQQMTTAIDKADSAMTHRWQQWQVTLSDNARLLAGHQSRLADQTNQLVDLVAERDSDSKSDEVRQAEQVTLTNAISQNETAIEATLSLQSSLELLSSKIELLSADATLSSQPAPNLNSAVAEANVPNLKLFIPDTEPVQQMSEDIKLPTKLALEVKAVNQLLDTVPAASDEANVRPNPVTFVTRIPAVTVQPEAAQQPAPTLRLHVPSPEVSFELPSQEPASPVETLRETNDRVANFLANNRIQKPAAA